MLYVFLDAKLMFNVLCNGYYRNWTIIMRTLCVCVCVSIPMQKERCFCGQTILAWWMNHECIAYNGIVCSLRISLYMSNLFIYENEFMLNMNAMVCLVREEVYWFIIPRVCLYSSLSIRNYHQE